MLNSRNLLNLRLLPLILTIAAGLLTLSLGAAIATRYFFVLPKIQQIEALSDHKDLRRVLLAIDSKKLQLVTLAYKNAMWDDMYYFAENHDDHNFFDNSLPIDTLTNFNINIVALFDSQKNIIEQRVIDDKQAALIEKSLPLAALKPYLIDLNKVHPHAPIFDSGYINTPDGPLLFAVASVMHSDSNSNAVANLFFATYFNDELRKEIQENAQVPITFAAPTAEDVSAAPRTEEAALRDSKNQLSWLLRDNSGQPVLKLVLTLPRHSYDVELWALPLAVSFITGILGAAGVLILLQKQLVSPLLGIGSYLREVRRTNNYTHRLDSKLRNELGELSRDIDALVQHVHIQQQQLQAQTKEMQALSLQDGLTGLANRRRFDQAITDQWANAQRTRTALALIMLDVDYFKKYNDQYGHQLGDEALKYVAAIIRRIVVRQSDVAARYGGEEFAILLPDTSAASAAKIAERIQSEFKNAAIPHIASAIDSILTASMGVAAITPTAMQNARELIQQADEALYAAKAQGRNRIVLATSRSAE